MQAVEKTLDERVLSYLRNNFDRVRHTNKGIKINVDKLDTHDISWLDNIECNTPILIKRSGTGLVIIIE